jgi:hypothetical protein
MTTTSHSTSKTRAVVAPRGRVVAALALVLMAGALACSRTTGVTGKKEHDPGFYSEGLRGADLEGLTPERRPPLRPSRSTIRRSGATRRRQ